MADKKSKEIKADSPEEAIKQAMAAQEKAQQEEWNKPKQDSWAGAQADAAKSHALAFFDIEDDLPLSRHLLLVAVVLFIILFIGWANFATLDEVTRGEGKVIPSSEIQSLQTLEPGLVEEFLVKEGDQVEKGEVLMRLSDIEAASDLGANNARYLGLLASITRLQAEAEGKSTVKFPEEVMKGAPQSVTEELNAFRANQQQIRGQVNIFESQRSQRNQEIRELQQRINDLRGVISLQREEMAMIEPLVAKGSAPRMELLQLERSMKEQQSELNSLTGSLPRARSAAGEVSARINEIKSTARASAQTELSVRLIELNELKERLGALKERKTRTEIKSPVHGTIKEINVNTVGGVVRPGEDIIQIVPKDDLLLVEVRIRPSDIAFLYPKQKAIVKLSAYDFAIFGGLDAKVEAISADTIEDEEGNSFYRVKLSTTETELRRKGEVLPIIPGMVATVDILTGEKTVMQYLLKPFIKTLDNAMNER